MGNCIARKVFLSEEEYATKQAIEKNKLYQRRRQIFRDASVQVDWDHPEPVFVYLKSTPIELLPQTSAHNKKACKKNNEKLPYQKADALNNKKQYRNDLRNMNARCAIEVKKKKID